MSEQLDPTADQWGGEILRAPIPLSRDPFVNTPLLAAGRAEGGEERFWISTWNSNVGCLGALVTEFGEARLYRFDGERFHGGFYSAALEDNDTLWLCGDLARVGRLTLSTGACEEFETGAPEALVYQGMALDRETGKLFALAYDYTAATAFSFDTRARRTAALHTGVSVDHYMRYGFPNGDGTYSFIVHCPGETMVHWDPRTETVEAVRYCDQQEGRGGGATNYVMGDERGYRYLPNFGWYDPRRRCFGAEGPRPEREMTWFARQGRRAWGVTDRGGEVEIGRWDMTSGEVRELCTIPDAHLHNMNVTSAGQVVAVNIYGEFFRFDGESGALERSRRLPTDSYGGVDCLCRIDADRLLGTPFITQRFWEVNLRTGQGYDCGRAAPGAGEVLKTWKIGGKIYMAAYTGGELVEYDPAQHPHFPENPRTVADPPGGMRPMGQAADGRHIYYSCSAEYGTLGSAVTRYDTVTGEARYARNPLPEQQVVSLCYDPATRSLLGATSMHADCQSCAPVAELCYFVRFDPDTLEVREQVAAPAGAQWAAVEGPLSDGRYLCTCALAPGGSYWDQRGLHWFALDAATLLVPPASAMVAAPDDLRMIRYAGKPGFFVLRRGQRVEVWYFQGSEGRIARVLTTEAEGWGVWVQEESVYLAGKREIVVLEGCLQGLAAGDA
jgi:hypothetical protein